MKKFTILIYDSMQTPSEIQIQAEVYTTLWKDYPDARRCLFHVPNESTYNNGQQAGSGVIPGVVDLIFVWNCNTWYIELKDDTGVLSRAQKLIHSLWKKQGFNTYVFYNAADCLCFLRDVIKGNYAYCGDEFYKEFISPHSLADKYDEYLAEFMKHRRESRAKKASSGSGFKFKKK